MDGPLVHRQGIDEDGRGGARADTGMAWLRMGGVAPALTPAWAWLRMGGVAPALTPAWAWLRMRGVDMRYRKLADKCMPAYNADGWIAGTRAWAWMLASDDR